MYRFSAQWLYWNTVNHFHFQLHNFFSSFFLSKKRSLINKVLPVVYLKRESGGLREHVLEGDSDVATSPDTKRALGFGREADSM